jgi:hypothetical protein
MASCVSLRSSLATLAAIALSLSAAGCTSLLGDFSSGQSADASTMDSTTPPGDGSMSNGDGNTNGLGKTCSATSDCATGQTCVDNVCCESACDGVCESCNQAGALGHCNPIPAMTDPDKECVMMPLPEAGPPEAGPTPEAGPSDASTDGASEAGDAGDAAPEASTPIPDAGEAGAGEGGALDASDSTFNLPDGSVTTTPSVCAGSCNGARACTYPDAKTACGTQFCNSSSILGGFSCDGTGRCGPSLADCNDYTCKATDAGAELGACGTACSLESDCTDKAFCNGQTCQPKLGNGIACTLSNQCATGFCVQGVCCNQACDPNVVSGGTCTASGSVGECTCPTCTGAGNSCVLWYRDIDGDGYGNKFGTVAGMTAEIGCSMETPPPHWSANNGDCDDNDINVNPAQTGFFTKPSSGTGTYDYNCDGSLTKQIPEFIGASCGTCENNPSCGDYNCGSGTGQTSLGCHSSIFCGILALGPTTVASDTHTLAVPVAPVGTVISPPIIVQSYCCSSGTQGITSFSGPTTSPSGSCGVPGTETYCGTCTGASSANYSTAPVTQGCH